MMINKHMMMIKDTTLSTSTRSDHSYATLFPNDKNNSAVTETIDSVIIPGPSVANVDSQNGRHSQRKRICTTGLNDCDDNGNDDVWSDDTDEDPSYSPSKEPTIRLKNRFPLFDFSNDDSDSDTENVVRQVTIVPQQCNTYNWCKDGKDPQNFSTCIFNENFRSTVHIDCSNPTSVFKLIFDDDLCKTIVDQSNLYAVQGGIELDLTMEEFDAFLGIIIFMGFHCLPSVRLYWSSDENFHVSRISRVMTLKRFLKILRYLHINDNAKMPSRQSDEFDKLYKIRPLLDDLQQKYRNLFSPSRFLAVDESMVGFKGRSSLKQFMPQKPIKRGFKIWVCACSITGFMLCFDVYTGKKKNCSAELGLGENVVINLSSIFREKGYCIFFDNFFSSLKLTKELLERQIFACGTMRQTRKGFPVDKLKKDKVIAKHDHDFVQSGDISIVKWKDRGSKTVTTISNMHNPSSTTKVLRTNQEGNREKVTCPIAIADYNKYMGGVDRFDQLMAAYSVVQKSRRWWVKLFYYFLDTAVVNSYILYVQQSKSEKKKPMTHLQFRSSLVNGLIGRFSSRKKRGFPAASGRARKRNSASGRPTVENSLRLCNVYKYKDCVLREEIYLSLVD